MGTDREDDRISPATDMGPVDYRRLGTGGIVVMRVTVLIIV